MTINKLKRMKDIIYFVKEVFGVKLFDFQITTLKKLANSKVDSAYKTKEKKSYVVTNK